VAEHAELQTMLTEQRAFPTPLTIGVLSDTHIWRNGRRIFPEEVPALFRRFEAGLILHGGDINDESVLMALAPIAPLIAVQGNNDSAELRSVLALQETFTVGDHRLGLIHGHGGRTARDVAFEAFPDTCGLVVYGHSHIPKSEQHGRTVFFNPGSPTDRRWGPHFGIGLIHCDEDGLHPELILFTRASDLDSVSTSARSGKQDCAR
jgi:putative phosphoesterase